MKKPDCTVSIGRVVLEDSDFSGVITRSALKRPDSAEFRLAKSSPRTRLVALTDRVVIRVDRRVLFSGDVVEAHEDGDDLLVRCSGVPQMDSDDFVGAFRASVYQGMRVIALDGGLRIPDVDEENMVSKAPSAHLDWDDLLDEAEAASDFLKFAEAVRSCLASGPPAGPEAELLRKGLAHVLNATKEAGYGEADAHIVPASVFRSAIRDWRANAWRYRRRDDPFEVIVPIRDLMVSVSPVAIGQLEYMDNSAVELVERHCRLSELGAILRDEWDLSTFVRATVTANDLWSARSLGRERILESLATIAFCLNYDSPALKNEDGQYSFPPFVRSSGACPTMAENVFIHNLATDEYWLGPPGRGRPPDLVEVASRSASLLDLLGGIATDPSSDGLAAHVLVALHWSYRAAASESLVDRFLLRWIVLERLLLRRDEKSPILANRVPAVVAAPGDKTKPLRAEIRDRWVPLRDEIVHRALSDHRDLAEGARRVQFFADAVIGHALVMAGTGVSFDEWLDYLDGQLKRGIADAHDALTEP
jgi:hypothetical protein